MELVKDRDIVMEVAKEALLEVVDREKAKEILISAGIIDKEECLLYPYTEIFSIS